MRFREGGPNIPNELLEARDQGEVVFFCGAGVSIPAGLPSFLRLAQKLVQELEVPSDSTGRRMLERVLTATEQDFAPPLDEVLGQLQREYTNEEIGQVLARCLRRPRHADLRYHSAVLKLSTDLGGKPRLVTTNFDLLFEAAAGRIIHFVSPSLPDLSHDRPLTGLVYLHGRLGGDRGLDRRRDLILGTADFGRAYLADGWATKFVRQLLDKYTVVLLGYSADDPPIRYLLEGLTSMRGVRKPRIYAFADARHEAVEVRWSQRGVVAIPYSSSNARHSALWDTLDAWAERAIDPPAWRSKIAALAAKSPLDLTTFERSQVTALVETAAGAKAFADLSPPPLAEWLCVFDPRARYARPGHDLFDQSSDQFDPLDRFGVEDDPPRPIDERVPGRDWLAPLPGDRVEGDQTGLAGLSPAYGAWSPRMFHLARWVISVANQPAAVWWASGRDALHPRLRDWLGNELDSGRLDEPTVRLAWELCLESRDRPRDPHSTEWYRLAARIAQEGWTASNLRQFAKISLPRVVVKRPMLLAPRPPVISGDGYILSSLINADVEYIAIDENAWAIPDHRLSAVTRILRCGLEEAAFLIEATSGFEPNTPPLDPQVRPGEVYHDDEAKYFLTFARLFERLTKVNPVEARAEFRAWDGRSPIFFDKLRVWALRGAAIASGKECALAVLALPAESFWRERNQRELLWTLRERWRDFSKADRKRIEARIVKGPARWNGETREAWRSRRGSEAAVRLGWLIREGCVVSESTTNRLPALRLANPRWREEWDASADESFEARSGWIATDTSTRGLDRAPLADAAALALSMNGREHLEFVEHRPFEGLVKEQLGRSLSIVAYELRHRRFEVRLWQSLISSWPDNARPRQRSFFASLAARLSDAQLFELRSYLPRWISSHFAPLLSSRPNVAWTLWDRVTNSLLSHGEEATRSGIAKTTVGGVEQERSRRTSMHALNSPTGPLVEALMHALNDQKLARNARMPEPFRTRFETTLSLPGEGSDHAVVTLTRQLRWLNWLDPEWVELTLVPMFAVDHTHAEAAWAGYLADNELVEPKLFSRLKQSFLALFAASKEWTWEHSSTQRLAQFLVIATWWGRTRREYLSYSEARIALRESVPSVRQTALWMLARNMSEPDGWRDLVRPFLTRAWPREARFQTSEASRRMVDIADEAGAHFPEVVSTLLPFLTPTDDAGTSLYHLTRKRDDGLLELAKQFPGESLALLDKIIPASPPYPPYNLAESLKMMADVSPELRQDLRWRRLEELCL